MKTTELYLEQVLIGFLIIAIAAMPWAQELWAHLQTAGTPVGIAGGSAAALSFAFWLGIPFDRLADSLSDRLDTRNRLAFALKPRKMAKPLDRNGDPISDPYPEDLFLILCRRDQPTVIRTWDYLRSRIRLSRALAVYAPALTLIATLAVCRWSENTEKIPLSTAALWFGFVIAAYLAWSILNASAKPKLPRTDDDLKYTDYETQWKNKSELSLWSAELRTWIVPALLLAASLVVGLIALCNDAAAFTTASAGTVLTVVSALSWWRISSTYRKFLLDCWQFRDNTSVPKAHGESKKPDTTSSPERTESDHHGAAEQSADTRGGDPHPSVHESGDATGDRPAGS
jgi:hypothetical protein